MLGKLGSELLALKNIIPSPRQRRCRTERGSKKANEAKGW